MKLLSRLFLACAVAVIGIGAAQQGADPDQILKEVQELRTKISVDARAAGKPISAVEVNAQIKAFVDSKLKDLDPAKLDAAYGYKWAQVYQISLRFKDACDLVKRYLDTKPGDKEKFSAQLLMMNSCNELGEADMILMTLKECVAPDALSSQALARTVSGSYSGTIATKISVDAALKAIDDMAKQLKFETPDEYAQRMLPSAKTAQARNAAGPQKDDATLLKELAGNSKNVSDGLKVTLATKKHDLLVGAKRNEEGLQVLRNVIKEIGADSPAAATPKATLARTELIGNIAPELVMEKQYGNFKSLADWKGKVVIVDFTAFW